MTNAKITIRHGGNFWLIAVDNVAADVGVKITDGYRVYKRDGGGLAIADRLGGLIGRRLKSNDLSEDDLRAAIAQVLATDDLVLCRSDTGDGGWSLHAPGSTDEQIASGDAPYLTCGESEWNEESGEWSRPNADDYRDAQATLASRMD